MWMMTILMITFGLVWFFFQWNLEASIKSKLMAWWDPLKFTVTWIFNVKWSKAKLVPRLSNNFGWNQQVKGIQDSIWFFGAHWWPFGTIFGENESTSTRLSTNNSTSWSLITNQWMNKWRQFEPRISIFSSETFSVAVKKKSKKKKNLIKFSFSK